MEYVPVTAASAKAGTGKVYDGIDNLPEQFTCPVEGIGKAVKHRVAPFQTVGSPTVGFLPRLQGGFVFCRQTAVLLS